MGLDGTTAARPAMPGDKGEARRAAHDRPVTPDACLRHDPFKPDACLRHDPFKPDACLRHDACASAASRQGIATGGAAL